MIVETFVRILKYVVVSLVHEFLTSCNLGHDKIIVVDTLLVFFKALNPINKIM